MTDDPVDQALAELQDLVRCRCHPAYTGRGLRDPDCECDSAEAVTIVADRIEAQAAEIERLRSALKKTEAQPLVLESVARGPMEGESMTSWIRYHMKEARATLAELTGDKP